MNQFSINMCLYDKVQSEIKMCVCVCTYMGFPGTVVKNMPANAGDTRDMGSVPG